MLLFFYKPRTGGLLGRQEKGVALSIKRASAEIVATSSLSKVFTDELQ